MPRAEAAEGHHGCGVELPFHAGEHVGLHAEEVHSAGPDLGTQRRRVEWQGRKLYALPCPDALAEVRLKGGFERRGQIAGFRDLDSDAVRRAPQGWVGAQYKGQSPQKEHTEQARY